MQQHRTHTAKSLREEVAATSVGAGTSQGITNTDGSPAEPPATHKKPSKPKSLIQIVNWIKEKS